MPTAWPWTMPKWAVRGLAAEWAAPSMLFSMAVPAQAAPSSIQPRASRSAGVASTRGRPAMASRKASREKISDKGVRVW